MDKIFNSAAKKALFAWKQETDGLDDLVNDLWVWYLERPGTQKQLQEADEFLARDLVYKAALQILAGDSLSSDLFNGRNLYSSESVKDALKGRSTNKYLMDILPQALEALSAQNEPQAEALRKRYTDGAIPRGKAAENLLVRAHKSITEHVNIITITAGVDANGKVGRGPSSGHAVSAESRKAKGSDHSDPTADMAINLMLRGDEEHTLCALSNGRPIPDGKDWVDSSETTTLRKEFVA